MPVKPYWTIAVVCLVLVTSTAAYATDLSLGTQPRGPQAEVAPPFRELIDYIREVTGNSVGLRYTESWLSYANDTRNDRFDISFDGAAFVSWRMHRQGHEILAQVAPVSGSGQHVVVVRQDNVRINDLDALTARTVCGRPAPNLATLVLLKEFPNPVRQPFIVSSLSYGDAYKRLLAGECEAALMGESAFNKHPEMAQGRVVFISKALPPAAITAGPRVSPEQKRRLAAALTAPEASARIGGFLRKYANDRPLIKADASVYAPHYELLKNEWGFGDD